MKRNNFYIYKSHGGKEVFSKQKLFYSLMRTGLPKKECQDIADKVAKEVGQGTKTREIYRKALKLVKETSSLAAVHYSLKKAIFDLGPSGHHFETYVAKYFQEKGFQTETCLILNGRLVKHEVDVIAVKDQTRVFVECKFHNRVGIKNDIKIALYIKARWDDLNEGPEGKNLDGFYLASNTAFSIDAITYAKGTNLKLLGVNAPSEKPFIEEIKELNLYPITSLKKLSRSFKNTLLSKNILLAKELPGQIKLLTRMGMLEDEINLLLLEVEQLRKHHL